MKHSILEKALRSYVNKAEVSELPDVINALNELAVVKELATYVMEDSDNCILQAETVWEEFSASVTYDIYGRLARQTSDNVTYDSFRSAVEHTYCFVEQMPRDYFLGVYETNKALWDENEQTGYNNPDGTYNMNKD